MEPIDLFGARSGATVMRELAVRHRRRALGPVAQRIEQQPSNCRS